MSVPKISPERRRSSCSKLPVSPLSVQTRIAASSSRVNLNLSSIGDKKQSPNRSTSSEEKLRTDNQMNKLMISDNDKTNVADGNQPCLSTFTINKQSTNNKAECDTGNISGAHIVITTEEESDLHNNMESNNRSNH